MKPELPADRVYLGEAATTYDLGRKGNPVTDEDDAAISRFLSEFSKGDTIGDAPCGTGRALAKVLELDLAYRGADISPDMIKICATKVPENKSVQLDLADARNLPWATGSCKGLISVKFLKWLPSNPVVLEVLKEYRRVCSGRALLNVKLKDEVKAFSNAELLDRLRKFIDRLKLGTSARYFRREEFERLLRDANWTIVRVEKNNASNNIVFNYIVE
jgi:SAM-dependent methyltransferase